MGIFDRILKRKEYSEEHGIDRVIYKLLEASDTIMERENTGRKQLEFVKMTIDVVTRRREQELEITRMICDITKEIVKNNKDEIPDLRLPKIAYSLESIGKELEEEFKDFKKSGEEAKYYIAKILEEQK